MERLSIPFQISHSIEFRVRIRQNWEFNDYSPKIEHYDSSVTIFICCPPEWLKHSICSKQISWFARSRLLEIVYFSRVLPCGSVCIILILIRTKFVYIPNTVHKQNTYARINWWNLSMDWSRFRLWYVLRVSVFSSCVHTYTQTYQHSF